MYSILPNKTVPAVFRFEGRTTGADITDFIMILGFHDHVLLKVQKIVFPERGGQFAQIGHGSHLSIGLYPAQEIKFVIDPPGKKAALL